MTQQQKIILDAEQLVRRTFSESFKQKITEKQIREVAAKMAKAIPAEKNKSYASA